MDGDIAFSKRLFLVIVFVVCCYVRTATADGADIVVLIDSSDSYRSTDFTKEKEFLQNFARNIMVNNNRMGLFTYGQQTDSQFYLNSFDKLANALNSIQYLWFSTGDGLPAPAINQSIYDGFSAASGNRECVPNVLVVLTHATISSADVIRLKRVFEEYIVRAFILDMSNSPEPSQFVKLTNDSSRVLKIDNFAALITSLTTLVDRISNDLPRSGCGQLGNWKSWTPCSVSCGNGLKFRVRECTKVKDTDKDCGVDLTEDSTCSEPVCIVVLDGGWSNWGGWGTCSRSCNNGTQTRTRACDEPIPANGGAFCVGKDIQSRSCSPWPCPDCHRICPSGGTLSRDCETCLCSSVTLFGRAMDTENSPVKNANIYLKSRQNRAVSTSDDWGYFSVSGVCLMNEEIIVNGDGYSTEQYTPYAVNSTHWTVNATVVNYVPPLFKSQPHDKIRMVGQSLTLCCDAFGVPYPTSYTWLKDGNELTDQGTDGNLVLNNLQQSDAGIYVCSVETEAGVSLSDEAEVTVDGHKDDTCSSPLSKIESLPNGCYVTTSSTKDRTVDVQTCGKATCMKSSLHDNGTCTDWWPNYCCDVDQIEKVNITCEGYSYETTRVTSCKCTLCVVKTILSGRAFGKKNGKKVPLQLGEVRYNGRFGAKTNMAGYFRFEVEKGIKRVSLTLHDGIFKKFIDSTRIIELSEGTEVITNIVLAFKPEPVPFTASIGSNIEIGGDKNGLAPAGSISIPGNALMDADGKPYDGSQGAKALVKYVDPRKVDDLEVAEGDFVCRGMDGKAIPLRTFGMFHLDFEDQQGNELRLNKPISVSLDASQFNVTDDGNGDSDLKLWSWDPNKGTWVEKGKMQQATTTGAGRRRLLANVLTGTVAPSNIPVMNPIDIRVNTRYGVVGYRRVRSGFWGNKDRTVPIYGSITTRTPVVKQGACVVSVSVYTDLTLTQKARAGSVTVTAFTKELRGNSYLGKKSDTIDGRGHVCLDVFCDQIVYIYAENGKGERLFPAQHTLPFGYPLINNTVREVSFESRNFGTAYDCRADPRPSVQTSTCKGPLFPYSERNICPRHNSGSSFLFQFAPFTRDPVFTSTVGDKNTYDKKLSWYPIWPTSNTFRSCFLKLSLKVKDNLDNFDIRVIGISHLETITGEQYGTYNVGPTPDPDSSDNSERGACIEFRCAGYIKDGSKEYFNKPTVVSVNINTGNKNLKCKINDTKSGIKIVQKASGMGFEFTADAGNNYGAKYGIYIKDEQASQVDDSCHSGYSVGTKVDGLMKPNQGYAVKMYCDE